MKGTFILCCLLLLSLIGLAQSGKIHFSLEGQGSYTTPDHVPFWMRSNQFGSIPLSGPSASLIGKVNRDYDTTRHRLLDWGVSLEGRANGGKGSELILVEGYGKVRLGIFQLQGGRIKEVMGLADTLLSSGGFAVSGTALGIPKVQISIPNFYTLPILGGVLAFKGNFAHGWLGAVPIANKRVSEAVTYFHQKSLWGRFGKADWKMKFYAGFNDNVLWGNERKIFESFILTDWQTYQSVALGKNWLGSKVGNHLGTIDVRLEYDFKNIMVAAYRQNFYEVGALYHLANIADGLNGIAFVNKNTDPKTFKWKRLLFELLYTKNQAGETWSKPTPSGDENYLNHYMYSNGWSYRGIGMGTPFITAANQAREGFPNIPTNYFVNNRVVAVHTGLAAKVSNWDVLTKLSFSRNFGTHTTKGKFKEANQFSAFFEGRKEIKPGLQIGGVIAFDAGNLLYNSGAALVKVTKSF